MKNVATHRQKASYVVNEKKRSCRTVPIHNML